jgi:hypothetical protein
VCGAEFLDAFRETSTEVEESEAQPRRSGRPLDACATSERSRPSGRRSHH